MPKSVMFVLRSDLPGMGKTYAGLSFFRPGVTPKRLVFDSELRCEAYHSEDDADHPDVGKFAYTEASGVAEALLEMATSLPSGKFPYNYIFVDNVTMWQNDLIVDIQTEAEARRLCDAYRITPFMTPFLGDKFRVSDTATYRTVLKGIVKAWLRAVRKAGVDLVASAENKNNWDNYGKRGKNPDTGEPWMKILGQIAAVWEPFLRMTDAVYVLDRMAGNRNDGSAKLLSYPVATLDTHDPKCSLVGLQPKFTFNNWQVIWDMLKVRKLPTAADFSALEIAMPVGYDDDTPLTEADVKSAVVQYALHRGVIKDNSATEKNRLVGLAKKAGLDVVNIQAQYDSWVKLVQELSDAHTD